jgi:hypothetical protein
MEHMINLLKTHFQQFFYNTYNLKQIVNEPTRVTKESKTLIDHIYITNLEKLQESHVVQYSVNDQASSNICFVLFLQNLYSAHISSFF